MASNAIVNDTNNNNDNKNVNDVKVHAVLTMVSSTPVNPTGRTRPLTLLDQAMGQHTLNTIFYYPSGSFEFERARPALNEVLTLYPNMTGRLAKDGDGNWEVKFTDAGVRVHFAKVGGSVDEWLRTAGVDDETRLTVQDELPEDTRFWSPFRMQVSEFEGGGTAIALSCPHMLADPLTLTLFIKSWTDTYHRDVITHPPFLHPVALKLTTATASPPCSTLNSAKSNPRPSQKMCSATFSFSDSTITKSLSEVSSVVPNATPFDLLTALFWSRIGGQKIAICMDMRKRLSAPLPHGYFGNAMYFSDLTLSNEEADLGQVTDLVHRHVAGVTEEEFLSSVNWVGSGKDGSAKMYGSELTFVSMEHMIAPADEPGSKYEGQALMYMARFDKDQKPAHVSYHVGNVEGGGLVMVMPSPDGGLARRVSVTLPEEEVRKLLADKAILRLNPTMMLTSKG